MDPQMDYRVYVEIVQREGARNWYIFETRQNESYVIGSRELAYLTSTRQRPSNTIYTLVPIYTL